MQREAALKRATSYLDEATENLTFDQYAWALEEVWCGVAWVLNALSSAPAELPDAGALYVPGRLDALLGAQRREAGRLVTRLESLRSRLDGADDEAFDFHASDIEQLVFDAWAFHDRCGRRLGLTDERLDGHLVLTEVSPGRLGSPVLHRRTALKLLLAGTAFPLQACTRIERDNRPKAKAAPATQSGAATSEPVTKVRDAVPLGGMMWQTSDPFLFCAYHVDHYPAGNGQMGPSASLEGRRIGRDFDPNLAWRMYHGESIPGFPRHPHRGFETVTFVRTGMLDHSDSMGATARYGGGDVQWLTAGGGIQHAEMFPLIFEDRPNPLELFQIWLNLPAADKMVDPYFTMLWSESIPRVVVKDSAGRVVELTIAAGAYDGNKPPGPPPNSWGSKPQSDLAIWGIRMEPGATFTLPAVNAGTERSLYVHRGGPMKIAQREIPREHRVTIEGNGTVRLEGGADEVEILLLQGRPIGEPVAKRGPFVMNTQDEIRQAYADYQRTQFGGWPWRDGAPVHTPDKGRFAKHIGGKFEEPT